MSPSSSDPNVARVAAAARKLGPLLDEIAFVGGCVTGLLLTDPAAAPVRPTLDVDAIVFIASYEGWRTLENRLRELGFHQPFAEGSPICRWQSGETSLDLMPTDPAIFGFSNAWYAPALQNAQRVTVDDIAILVVSAPYFVATKMEAFHGRGKNDFHLSRDLEDIVAIVDGRPELVEEVRACSSDLQQYLSAEFRALLSNREFMEALPGHLLSDAASQQRLNIVIGRMRQILLEG